VQKYVELPVICIMVSDIQGLQQIVHFHKSLWRLCSNICQQIVFGEWYRVHCIWRI